MGYRELDYQFDEDCEGGQDSVDEEQVLENYERTENSVISPSYASAEPWAVVVELFDTVVTYRTMGCPRRSKAVA